MASGTVRNEGFDHMTVVVTDLGAARGFFGLLGFVERVAVVARGEEIGRYMGIEDWEADHVTLVLEGAPVHQEVQLLRFHHPAARPDDGAGTLTRLGFNHVCFHVADLDAVYDRVIANGAIAVWGPRESPEPGMRMAYVTDPDGNLIELVAPA